MYTHIHMYIYTCMHTHECTHPVCWNTYLSIRVSSPHTGASSGVGTVAVVKSKCVCVCVCVCR